MKRIKLAEERREIDETELRSWLCVPDGYRLASVNLRERKDARLVEISFTKFEGAASISIATARELADDARRVEIAKKKAEA